MSEAEFGLVTYLLYPELVDGDVGAVIGALDAIDASSDFGTWEIPWRADGVFGRDDVRRRLKGKRLLIGTQTTFIQTGLCLSCADSGVRSRARQSVTDAIALAARLGAEWVAVWGGDSTDAQPADRERFVDELRPLAAFATERRVRLLLEPFPRCSFAGSVVATLADAQSVCDEVPGLAIMFDPAHHQLEGGELPPISWRHVGYVQLCAGGRDDSGGAVDSHPLFGAPGSMATLQDIGVVVHEAKLAGYRGPYTYEVKAGPGERVGILRALESITKAISVG